MWLKRQFLFLRYYLKAFAKAFFHWPMLLFGLSLLLFLAIMIPNLLGRLPIFRTWDRVYAVKGTIKGNFKNKNNLLIEIGGRSTFTLDSNGTFSLKFPSTTSTNIPVLITSQDTFILKRISFSKNSFVLDTSLIIH